MPKRMGLEDLLADQMSQMILGRFAEMRTDMLRPRDLREGLKHGTLHNRLKRLCEYGVLQKVDEKGNPTEGGRAAPKTYYKLLGEHWKTSVKCADLNRLREHGYEKMASRLLTTVYGFDASDFENDEEGLNEFAANLKMMDLIATRMLLLKARVLQRRLGETFTRLEDGIKDPVARWVVKSYFWMTAVAPVLDMDPPVVMDFVSEVMPSLLSFWKMAGVEIDDEGLRRLMGSSEHAMAIITQGGGVVQEIRRIIEANHLTGVVVSHIRPHVCGQEASSDRMEGIFRQRLKSRTDADLSVSEPFFDWLEERLKELEEKEAKRHRRKPLNAEESLKYSKEPFEVTLKTQFRAAPEEMKEEIWKEDRRSEKEYAAAMILNRLLEMPNVPTPEEAREYLDDSKRE